MKKIMSAMVVVLCGISWLGYADSNGDQPPAPPGMSQPPIAGVPQTDAHGVPKLAIEFAPNHSDIPGTFSRDIDAFGKYLQQHPETRADIVAYSDHTGHTPANVKLSRQRAEAVKKCLVANYSIAANRIKARGYGEVSDKLHNDTEAARQADRQAVGTIVNP